MTGPRPKTAGHRNKAVRMKDVADYLNLSVATVSRAISDPEQVSLEKRKRIEDAIAKLNYRPNLVARTLRRQESRTAFIVFPDLSPIFLDAFRGAERAAEEIGYTALMGHCARDKARERMFLDQALSGRADGVVLVASTNGADIARRRKVPPLVSLMEGIEGSTVSTVQVDHRAGARAATEHLIELGHRRVGHIAGPPGEMATLRRAGFEDAAAGADLDPRHCYVVPGSFTIASGEAAMERLLTRHPRPTAVFCANDEMAVGAMQSVKRAGLRIGVEISIVGFDDQRIASLYEPQLTTMHVPMADLGYQAMMLLHRVIHDGAEAECIVLPTKLVVRATTGPPPALRDDGGEGRR